MTRGDLFTYNGRMVVSFIAVSLLMTALPFLVLIKSGNYWITFFALVIYGIFSGVS
jgi:hypothetical protein